MAWLGFVIAAMLVAAATGVILIVAFSGEKSRTLDTRTGGETTSPQDRSTAGAEGVGHGGRLPRRESNWSVGIDAGTTKTVIASFTGGAPHVVRDRRNRDYMPSVVGRSRDGAYHVGWRALEHPDRFSQPHETVLSIKRRIARRDPSPILGQRPEVLTTLILGCARREVQRSLNRTVKHAVVAIPAHFDFAQRQATKTGAELSGWTVSRLLNEPTAVALGFAHAHPSEKGNVAVVDLGGGTLDVSVVEIGDGVCEVLGTAGDALLGGDDFNERIFEHTKSQSGGGWWDSPGFTQIHKAWLHDSIERVKVDLSSSRRARLHVSGFFGPGADLDVWVGREAIEDLTRCLVVRVVSTIERALERAQSVPVHRTVLVGGASNTPAIRRAIEGMDPLPTPMQRIDPFHCVALGAAVQAAIMNGETSDYVLVDRTGATLGVITGGESGEELVPVIPCNTPIPTTRTQIFTTVRDYQTSIEVHIYEEVDVHEDEFSHSRENIWLGKVTLPGIGPAPRGVPQIEVAFSLDVDGILDVTATDVATHRSVQTRFEALLDFPEDEKERTRMWVSTQVQQGCL